MEKFRKVFSKRTSIIGMIHLNPLPGTPNYKNGTFDEIIEKAKFEANVYLQNNIVSRDFDDGFVRLLMIKTKFELFDDIIS